MINFSFDDKGLHIPTYEELYDDTIKKLKEYYGEDFYLDDESPDNQMISTILLNQFRLAEALQLIYNSLYPDTAQGVNLDRICALQEVVRQAPSKSKVQLKITGDPETDLKDTLYMDVNNKLWQVLEGKIAANGEAYVDATSLDDSVFAGIGEINKVVDAPSEVKTVYNEKICLQGTKKETDNQLRFRRRNSVMRPAIGTLEAISGALLNLDGVVKFAIKENSSALPDGSLPAHSIGVSIIGGDDNEIAKLLYDRKSIGCAMGGNTVVSIPIGNHQVDVKFYRPKYTEIKITVTLARLDGYVVETKTRIANAIKEYISQLDIGEPVFIGSIYNICYKESPTENVTYNVSKIVLERKVDEMFTPSENNIPVGFFDLLVLSDGGIIINDD